MWKECTGLSPKIGKPSENLSWFEVESKSTSFSNSTCGVRLHPCISKNKVLVMICYILSSEVRIWTHH